MKLQLLLLLFITTSFCFSQNNEPGKAIILHPAVGKVIDNSEKKLFKLFPEYKDSTFNNAFILKYNDSTFSAIISDVSNKMIEKPLSRKELDEIYYQIDNISKQNLQEKERHTDEGMDPKKKHKNKRK